MTRFRENLEMSCVICVSAQSGQGYHLACELAPRIATHLKHLRLKAFPSRPSEHEYLVKLRLPLSVDHL